MAISENLQLTCCRGFEETRTSPHFWWGYNSVHLLGKEYESQSESRSVVSDSFQPYGLYSPWNSPGQNTRVGSCFLVQGIFPTERSNPGLLHCMRILYQLSHQGIPKERIDTGNRNAILACRWLMKLIWSCILKEKERRSTNLQSPCFSH